MGEAVEAERGEHQEQVEHLVRGQRQVSGFGALRHEDRAHRDHAQRAQHDVAVDGHHAAQARRVEQRAGGSADGQGAQRAPHVPDAERKAGVLGHHRCNRHACDAHAETEHQHEVQRHVDRVGEQLDHQRRAHVAQAIHPSDDRVGAEYRRQRPDADQEVLPCVVLDLGTRIDCAECERGDRPLQRDHRAAGDGSQQQRAPEHHAHLCMVARPACLCSRAGGTHAQAIEQVIDEVEQHRADRDRADVVHFSQVPDNGGVHCAEQRHREVGEDDRASHRPDLAMGHRYCGRAGRAGPAGHWPGRWHAQCLSPVASARSSTRATCTAPRCAPSRIWWRQLVPSATSSASGAAARIFGSTDSSPIFIEVS